MPEPYRLWTALEVAKKLTETREALIRADNLLSRINLANPNAYPEILPIRDEIRRVL